MGQVIKRYHSPNEQRGGGGVARLFLVFSLPCSGDHERDWPSCTCEEVLRSFFELATIIYCMLNARNNDRLMLFPLFFWSTRDHNSQFKSMYQDHLCVVALTSIERGTNPVLPAYLLLPRVIRHLLFIYFQVNNGVLYFLYYVEDIYNTMMVLSVLVLILNPNHMYLPLISTVYCNTM